MRILYLIIARGGSKSIPRKNLQKLGGLSLVGFKARSAQRALTCARVVISTDDPEIQDEARGLGVEVPFTRPADLATDTASTDDVIVHAIEYFEARGERYDAVMALEASTPFARAADYDAAAGVMAERNASVVMGVREMEVNSVYVGPMETDGRIADIARQVGGLVALRRQDQPPEYTLNGAYYLLRWEYMRTHRSRYRDPERTYGVLMDRAHSIEIDEPLDLVWARFLVESGRVDMADWNASN